MPKKSHIIPFSWWPSNWGLSGKRRAEAEAEYYWEGKELDYLLLDIRHDDHSSQEYHLDRLKLDYRYHEVDQFEYGLGLITFDPKLNRKEREIESARYLNRLGRISSEELEYKIFDLSYDVKDTEEYLRERLKLDVKWGKKSQEDADRTLLDMKYDDKSSIDYQIAVIGLDLKWGKINQNQHDKSVATLLREPWFNLIGADKVIKGENVRMAIELDWNEFFIEFLESKGWSGVTPDEIVDRWFEEAMRQMLQLEELEEIDGGEDSPLPMAGINRNKRDDGLTEYS